MALRAHGAKWLVFLVLLPLVAAAEEPTRIEPPRALEMPEIPVPAGAKSDKPVVDVQVRLVITATGEVREVELVSGAGEPFDSAVLAGARHFRFQPALVNGVATEVALPYVHHFVVAPPTPPPAEDTGPKRDAILNGIVQERGTRSKLAGIALVLHGAGFDLTATTDPDGHFRIEVPSGETEVRVVDSLHRPFLQREKLATAEELKVRYLLDRISDSQYESVVIGSRQRDEVSRTTLSGRELTRIPGTFGDPFRVVTVLPGVSTIMSLLPYPIVRGSSPGNTGELLDGVHLPLLYHLLAGPAVVHPEIIERVDFYPGGFPVQYGGYTGGIIDGVTRKPNPQPLTEIDLGLTQAGALLRRTSESLGVTATLAGRYGYPGLLLSLLSPDISLSYWDYQARLDGNAFGGHWTVFGYGARDNLKQLMPDAAGNLGLQTVLFLETHHLDLRWLRGNEEREWSARLVLMDDDSRTGTDSDTRTIGAMPQLRLRQRLVSSLTLDVGLDALVRSINTTRSAVVQQALETLQDALEDSGTVFSSGAFLQLRWKPFDSLIITPGVRGDVAHDAVNTQWSADPRLLLRWRVHEGETGTTWLKAAVGIYHQPPRLALPLPGADEAKLSFALLASKQASVGAEVQLGPGVDLDVQTYFNSNNPVLFDLSINQDLSQILNAAPTTDPGNATGVQTNGRNQQTQNTVNRLFTPSQGRAFGLEVMLRKRDTDGFFGWIAYTFSRSERLKDGAWSAFDFDRTHIMNGVMGIRLPRNWELGTRLLVQTGTPATTIHGYNAGRTDPNFRLDIRVDKRAVWNNWLMDFYIDIINSTVAADTGGLEGSASIRYVLPTIGFRAVL